MSDSFQTTTSQNWFQRIQSSLVGILIGLLLFAIGIGLLWWNEGRSVATQKSLKEGRANVVNAKADTINAEDENKLIHVSGPLAVTENPEDPDFGVTTDAVKLNRSVEMFQWIESSTSETKQKLGGGEETVTTYKYAKDWSGSLQKSSEFQKPDGHTNPSDFPVDSQTFEASGISLGAFALGDALVNEIGWFESYSLPKDTKIDVEDARIQNGLIYVGADPANPQVGDLKVSYEIVPLGDASIVARQDGDMLTSYPTRVGRPLALARAGNLSADEMFALAESDNRTFTWVLRLFGFILIWVGLNLVGRPFSVVASVVPFAGRIVGMFTGLAAFLIAAAISLLVIALAWLAFRPVLGVILLLIAGAFIGWGFSKAKKKPKPVAA